MKKLISVIVPVYNAEKVLDDCVRSILSQDDALFELLLVDDASTDDSGRICDVYAAADERVRVIHASHGGAAASRNRGIEEAKGAYICFTDSDDLLEADYLSYLRSLLEENDADIAACGYDKPLRRSDGRLCLAKRRKEASRTLIREGDEVLKALLYQRGLMSVPWGYLSKRSLWEKVRFPEGTEAEDMGTIYRLFLEAERLACGSRICYHYVQDSGSTIYTTAPSRKRAYYKHCREMLHRVRLQRPSCHKAALSRHFSACAQNLSETPLGEHSLFLERSYQDLKCSAGVVSRDKEARKANRAAALIAGCSPRILHILLRAYYNVKLLKMRKS